MVVPLLALQYLQLVSVLHTTYKVQRYQINFPLLLILALMDIFAFYEHEEMSLSVK